MRTGVSWLGLVPVLDGDVRLAKYLFDQTHADVTDMGIRNTNLLASFDHELVLRTRKGA